MSGSVKREGDNRHGAPGWRRHVEGWQPALLAVAVAASGTFLVIPRATPPIDWPTVAIAPRELEAVAWADRAAARAVASEPLDVDVRKVGTALRAFGRAERDGEPDALRVAQTDLGRALGVALRQPPEALARLRAVQLEAFLREVRAFIATGVEGADLIELGGSFLSTMTRSGWVTAPPSPKLVIDEAALRAAFKLRFARVLQLEPPRTREARPANDVPLDPGAALPRARAADLLELLPVERRAWLRFVIEHPPTSTRDATTKLRLRWIDELGALDARYPAEFAKGTLHFGEGRYELALESFRRHLDASPDGPLALRARNHLVATRERIRIDRAP